jgi:hypothetical protein
MQAEVGHRLRLEQHGATLTVVFEAQDVDQASRIFKIWERQINQGLLQINIRNSEIKDN